MALGTAGMVVTAALVAGLAGAGAALVVGGARSPSPASGPDEVRRVADLEVRITRQDNELRSLRARLDEAEAARTETDGGGVPPGVLTAKSEEMTVYDPETLEPVSGPGARSQELAALPPEERARVEKLFMELRAKEQEENRKARRQAQEVRMRGRLDRLPVELGLAPETKDSVVRSYMDLADRRRAIFEEARAAGTPEALRAAQEKSQAARDESRQALSLILNPEQLKAVEQVVDRGMPASAGRLGARDGRQRVPGGARDGATSPGTPPR